MLLADRITNCMTDEEFKKITGRSMAEYIEESIEYYKLINGKPSPNDERYKEYLAILHKILIR